MFTLQKISHLFAFLIAAAFCVTGNHAHAASATVVAGQPVTLSTTVDGTAPFTYQWYKDGVILSGATSATFQISAFQASNVGIYSAVITNPYGSTTSDAATLALAAAPFFTTQPTSQTVAAGSAVTFTSAAGGLPAPAFQWKLNGTTINGATGGSLTIANVQASNAGTYTVVTTNPVGSATSNGALLTVSAVTGAPTITTQPTSQTAIAGAAVTLTAAAGGSPTPTYQWRKDGVNLSGATNSSYVISNVASGNSGTYTMVATNSVGSASSNGAVLTVSATNTAPTITAIPAQTSSGAAVGPVGFVIGDAQTAVGSLSVTGTSSNTALLLNGNIVFGGSGANRTVTVTPAAGRTGTATITLTVSDGSLSTNTTFTLTVNAAPIGLPVIVNAYGAHGIWNGSYSSATVSNVAPTGANRLLLVTLNFWAGSTSGVTFGGVPLTQHSSGDWWGGGKLETWYLINPSTTAGNVVITFNGTVGEYAAQAFTLTGVEQATPLGVPSGAYGLYTSTTVAPASTTADLVLFNVVTANDTVPAASGLTLVREEVSNSNSESNTLFAVAGSAGSTTATITQPENLVTVGFAVHPVLAANTAPTITTLVNQTTTTAVVVGPLAFTVGDAQTGVSSLTMSSSSSNTTLVPAGNIVFGGSGASRTVTVTPAAGQNGTATITLTVSDGVLTASNSFLLTVSTTLSAPVFTAQPVGTTVMAGTSVTFTAAASGNPLPTWQWRKGGVAISGATNATYSISSVAISDANTYSVVAANSVGSATSVGAMLTVNTVPAITTQPLSHTVTAGANVTFTVAASGTPSPTYQWKKEGVNLSGATAATYTITNSTTSNAGTYTVVASNSAGTALSAGAILTVDAAAITPVFTTQPTSQTVAVGANVTFTAAASGSPTPTYQWRKGGVTISGATGATYTIASVTTGSASTYSVVATNSAGSATSSNATLTVNAASTLPVITTQPETQTVTKGSVVTFKVVATSGTALTYQWWKNGTKINLATGTSYRLSNVSATSAGTYTVVVKNSSGSVTSSPAALTVNAVTSPMVYRVDFNGDGKSDVLWQNLLTGECSAWLMNGPLLGTTVSLGTFSVNLRICGTGDFNGDGRSDILVQNTATGECSVRLMNGTAVTSVVVLANGVAGLNLVASGDFNGDGKSDLLWQDSTTGECSVWLMAGSAVTQIVSLGDVSPDLMLTGTGDFNSDGRSDILWQNSATGEFGLWLMAGTTVSSSVSLGTLTLDWQMSGTGDFNSDGKSDILWHNLLTGACRLWVMNGTSVNRKYAVGTMPLDWVLRN